MTMDDLKRLFTSRTLSRLDAVLAPKLVPIFYALGLAGILLWAVAHFFFTFSLGFGIGLWGLLEIVVFGLLYFVGLRILCEGLLVFFRRNESEGEPATRSRYSASLLDEVREAIRDLAEESEDPDYSEADDYSAPATEAAPYRPSPPPEPVVTLTPSSPGNTAPKPATASAAKDPAAKTKAALATAEGVKPKTKVTRSPATKSGEVFKPRRTAKRSPAKKPE